MRERNAMRRTLSNPFQRCKKNPALRTLRLFFKLTCSLFLVAVMTILFGWERWISQPFVQNLESMAQSSSTLVTAYFKVSSKHSHGDYLRWMHNFLSMEDSMIIFTTPSMIDDMKKFRKHKMRRTYFVPMEVNELPPAKKYSQSFWQNQLDMDYEKEIHKSYELFWIWLSKSWFVSEAIRLNPFHSDIFLYSDIGCFRSDDYIQKRLIRHENIVPRDRVLFLAWDTPDPPMSTKIWNDKRQGHFYQVGGWIAGYSSALLKFHERFEDMISQFAELNLFVGEDQAVLMSTCLHYPELCEYIQAKDIPDDAWFGLRYALHNGGVYDRWTPPTVEHQGKFHVRNGYLFLYGVNCGGHFAPTCRDCLDNYGANGCNGDCVFSRKEGGVCQLMEHHSSTADLVKFVVHQSLGGRLGNQLFEHAATLVEAKRSGKLACVFGKNVNLIDDYFVGEHFHRNCGQVSPLRSVKEIGYATYTPIPESDISLSLEGYYQSWKYFEGQEAEIKRIFTLKPEHVQKADDFLRNKSSVSFFNVGIHLRWFEEDYLVDPPDHFYSWAMNHFKQQLGQRKAVRFYIASSDIERVQRLDVFNTDGVSFLKETSTAVDFAILMKCDGMILSSGTFGWWAAWLGPHQRGGEVIYNSDVFDMNNNVNKGQVTKEDYYPPEWRGISSAVTIFTK